jgi:hypothetical protein
VTGLARNEIALSGGAGDFKLAGLALQSLGNIVRGYAVIQFHGDFLQFSLTVIGWVVPYPREERYFDDSTLANRVKAGSDFFSSDSY